MIDATISVIGTLLKADGISDAAIKTALAVIRDDGMVTTTQASRALQVSTKTVKRMCASHGVRRVSRHGRQGALVDLVSLQRIAAQ
jgi:Asp/Glu/hydantoin racemase